MIIHYITVLIILFLFLDNYINLHMIRLANCNFNQILNPICMLSNTKERKYGRYYLTDTNV
jgi:hypothetical protein